MLSRVMRGLVLSVLGALLISGCKIGSVVIVTEDRHGNSPTDATPVEEPSMPSMQGYLTRGDSDYFRVTIAELTYLRVATSGSTDTLGVLLDHAGRVIAADDDSGSAANFRLGHRLSPDVYYLRVSGASPRDVGRYALTAEFSEFDEHGSSRNTATYVPLDSVVGGFIRIGDVDYFKTVVDEFIDGNVVLSVYSTGRTDTEAYLEDAYGVTVDYDDDRGKGFNFFLSERVPAGTYYVRVEGFSLGTVGAYRLFIES